jgi:hypothetical protein
LIVSPSLLPSKISGAAFAAEIFEIKVSQNLADKPLSVLLFFIFTAAALLISPSLLPSKALSAHSSPFYLILRRALLRLRWGRAKAYFGLALEAKKP